MVSKNFTRFAVLFLILAASSCFAQTYNGAISCYGPLRSMETYGNPPLDTDDGSGSLQMTINCTMVPKTGASGYLSAFYESNTVTLQHDIDVSLTSGIVATDGLAAGWAFTLEVTLPSGQKKRYALNYNSFPTPGAMLSRQWPISIHVPAGSTLQAEVYGFAGSVSVCSSTCYGNAQWTLQ